jgi:hypothetical protein
MLLAECYEMGQRDTTKPCLRMRHSRLPPSRIHGSVSRLGVYSPDPVTVVADILPGKGTPLEVQRKSIVFGTKDIILRRIQIRGSGTAKKTCLSAEALIFSMRIAILRVRYV